MAKKEYEGKHRASDESRKYIKDNPYRASKVNRDIQAKLDADRPGLLRRMFGKDK